MSKNADILAARGYVPTPPTSPSPRITTTTPQTTPCPQAQSQPIRQINVPAHSNISQTYLEYVFPLRNGSYGKRCLPKVT